MRDWVLAAKCEPDLELKQVWTMEGMSRNAGWEENREKRRSHFSKHLEFETLKNAVVTSQTLVLKK